MYTCKINITKLPVVQKESKGEHVSKTIIIVMHPVVEYRGTYDDYHNHDTIIGPIDKELKTLQTLSKHKLKLLHWKPLSYLKTKNI